MNPTFKTSSSTESLSSIAEQAYRLVNPGTTGVDERLRTEVEQLLIEANGDIDPSVDLDVGSVVELPYHGGAPYAIYPVGTGSPEVTQTAVNDLGDAGYRSLRSVRTVDESTALPDVAGRDTVWAIADLARIPEIGVALGYHLAQNGFTTAQSLTTATQPVLAPLLQGFATAAQLESTPPLGVVIVIRAQDLYPPTPRTWRTALGVPVAPSRLRELTATWRAKAAEPGTEVDRASAGAIARLYDIGASLLDAHVALGLSDTVKARAAYRKTFGLVHAPASTAEVWPPLNLTPADVLAEVKTLLETMTFSHIGEAIDIADLDPDLERWNSLSGFRLSDIGSASGLPNDGGESYVFFENVDNWIPDQPLWVFGGRRVGEALFRHHAEAAIADVFDVENGPAPTAHPDSRLGDLDLEHQAEALAILQSRTFRDIKDSEERAIVLDSCFFGTGIPGAGAEWRTVSPNPSLAIPASVGAIEMTDRISVVRRDGAELSVNVRLLESQYGDRVLLPQAQSPNGGLYLFREDFLDPARFAVMLPTLLFRHTVFGVARIWELAGKPRQAANTMRNLAVPGAWDLERSMNQWVSAGAVAGPEMSHEEAERQVGISLRDGHRHYQNGRLDAALSSYERCRTLALTYRTVDPPVDPGPPWDETNDVNITDGATLRQQQAHMSDLIVLDTFGFASRAIGMTREPETKITEFVGGFDRTILSLQSTSVGFVPPDAAAVAGYRDSVAAYAAEALMYIKQIQAGLNWLGFQRSVIPTWSFDVLLSHARQLGQLADRWQQRALSLLESVESSTFARLQAENALEEAELQAFTASAQVDLAEAQQKEAVLATKHFNIEQWSAFAGVVAGSIRSGGLLKGSFELEGVENIGNAVDMFRRGSTGTIDALGQLAEMALQMGATTNALATREEVAGLRVTAALAANDFSAARVANGKALLHEMKTRELTEDALGGMVALFEVLSEQVLHTATQMAWLAERAHTYQFRSRTELIRQAYYDEFSISGRFASAASLQADIETLASHRLLKARQPLQMIKTTVSLAERFPATLLGLRATGSAYLALDLADLDRQFPGLYLHQLRHIDFAVDGTIPTSGVTAMLHTAPVMKVRVPNTSEYVDPDLAVTDWAYDNTTTAPYVQAWVQSRVHTEVFSEYSIRTDRAAADRHAGEVSGMANISPSGLWRLEIPREASRFDLEQITDVRLTLFFTAEHDPSLANAQRAVAEQGLKLRGAALFSGRNDAAASRAAFIDGPADVQADDIRHMVVDVEPEQLHPGWVERRLTNLDAAFVGLGSATVRLLSGYAPFGVRVVTDSEGQLFSAIGEADVVGPLSEWHTPRDGDDDLEAYVTQVNGAGPNSAASRWVVKMLPEAANAAHRTQGVGTVYMLEFPAGGGTATSNGELFAHAGATAVIGGLQGGGSIGMALRSAPVRLQLTNTAGTLTVELEEGGVVLARRARAVDSIDESYELTLQVFGGEAVALLDRVEVLRVSLGSSTGAGAMTVSGGGGAWVSSLRVERLGAVGQRLGTALTETFPDASGFALAGTAAHSSRTAYRLALGTVEDLRIALSYEGREPVSQPPDVFVQPSTHGHQVQGPHLVVEEEGGLLVLARLDDTSGVKLLLRSGVLGDGGGGFELVFDAGVLRFRYTLLDKSIVAAETQAPTDTSQRTLYYVRWSATGVEVGWRQGDSSGQGFSIPSIILGTTAGDATKGFRIFDNDGSRQLTGAMSYLVLGRTVHNQDLDTVAADNSFASLAFDTSVSLHPHSATGELNEVSDPATDIADVAGTGSYAWVESGSDAFGIGYPS